MDSGGRPPASQPAHAKPTTPGSAISGPVPLAVATACRIDLPYSVSSGTTNVAPPMLINVEIKPITEAASSGHGNGGRCSPRRQSSRPSAILRATTAAAMTHTHFNVSPLEDLAVSTPTMTPPTTHGAARFNSGMSTEPLARCPANDFNEVGR